MKALPVALLFFTLGNVCTAVHAQFHQFGEGCRNGASLAFTEQTISDLRYRIAETKYRIQLRLNPKESEHIELLRLMQVAMSKQQDSLSQVATTEQTLHAVEIAAAFAPQVLKSEWERVKKGELAFRLARNWFAPLTFGISLLFVILLWLGKVYL